MIIWECIVRNSSPQWKSLFERWYYYYYYYCEEEFPSMEIAIFSQATISSWTIHHQASASRARWICSQVWSHLCKFVKYVNITSVQVCNYVKYVNFVWSQSVHQINTRSPLPPSTLTDTYTKKQEHAIFEGPYCQNVQKKN